MAHSGKTMTFATDLVPQEDNIYNLGQENLKWIIRGSLPLSDITGADDLKAIEAISGTTGLLKKTAANTWALDTNSYVTSSGITSVTIGATSPVQSSTSTAQNGSSASTTISLANAYGDTKNPYGSKTKNYVLAAPSNANGAPSFRALVAADIPVTLTRAQLVSTEQMSFTNWLPKYNSGTAIPAKTMALFADGLVITSPATGADAAWIRVTGTSEADATLEIATSDDAAKANSETIVVRQYNSSSAQHEAVLLGKIGDVYGATSFPVQVTAPKFIGNLTGTADKATADASGNTITSTYLTKAAGVTNVAWDSTNNKITKTINGTTSDVVTAATLKAAINVTAGDLGLSSALRYKGTTTTAMSDGLTTAAITIGGSSYTPIAGDVVIYNDAEYLWTGSLWELIGAESSFKKVQTAVSSSSATGSSATTFVSSVTQDTQGVITVKTSTLNTSGTWSGNATSATTATNLANNPSIQVSTSNANQVTITAGGKTSSAYTIPYATSAGSAATATTATYIKCTDTRSAALNPTDLNAASGVRFDFKAKGTIDLTATDSYAGVMSFRPYASGSDWSGGNAHQLAFNSEGLHWRNGGASWGDWYQILDSSNTYAPSSVPTLSWGNTSTIFTLNGTEIKIKAMAKPTYTYSDVGAAPSSTISCTTANVKSALNTGSDTTKFLNNKGDWAIPAYTTSLAWSAITNKPNLSTGNARIFYGTSSTAAGTAAKVVTCSIYDAYTAGDILVVKFDNANTAGSPTLNVNSKGAKNIRKIYNGAVNALNVNGEITGTCMFVYDGTQWLLTNADYNNTYTIPTSFSITANATDGLWDIAGTGGNNQVTYAVGAYSSKQTGASFYTGTTDPDGTTRLNYNGYLYATKLYSNGTEVSVSGHTHSYLSSISWSGDANLKLKQSVNGATATDVLQFAAGSNITLTGASGKITIAGTPDTKNTAGSTNSTSKLFLIGATTQDTNPTTNSYQYTYTTEGLLSSTQLGLNAAGTEKVHLEWNATDNSLDFVFA